MAGFDGPNYLDPDGQLTFLRAEIERLEHGAAIAAGVLSSQANEIERLTKLLQISEGSVAEFIDDNTRLRAALTMARGYCFGNGMPDHRLDEIDAALGVCEQSTPRQQAAEEMREKIKKTKERNPPPKIEW